MLKEDKGFTLVELILVITILAILAVVALPKMQNVISGANEASHLGVLNNVRSAIRSHRIDDEMFGLEDGKPEFDEYFTAAQVETGTTTNGDSCESAGCFGGLLTDPVYDPHWIMVSRDTTNNTVEYKYDVQGSNDDWCYLYTQGGEDGGTFAPTEC